jgi:predicted aldo/keto reductase-like oxidoreductase
MERMRLGRTNLRVGRTAFGALPIQRIPLHEAAHLLTKAYAAGVTFFDTARGYTDSEQKIGCALASVRRNIVLATKTGATDRKTLLQHLDTSLKTLKTDTVDILQLHNPRELPDPKDPDSAYAGLLEAREKGTVRFIGISSHRLDVARKAVESGLFDTVQFPLSAISDRKDLALVELCREHDVGLIAMKGMCGGLLTDATSAFAFLRQFENVLPIWGVQRQSELDQFLALEENPPVLDDAMLARIEKDRLELADDFCRGCGYCLPCPQDIPIPMAARMSLLMRRAPWQQFITTEWQEKMRRIKQCTECGQCRERCPYELDTPTLLRKMLTNYEAFIASKS